MQAKAKQSLCYRAANTHIYNGNTHITDTSINHEQHKRSNPIPSFWLTGLKVHWWKACMSCTTLIYRCITLIWGSRGLWPKQDSIQIPMPRSWAPSSSFGSHLGSFQNLIFSSCLASTAQSLLAEHAHTCIQTHEQETTFAQKVERNRVHQEGRTEVQRSGAGLEDANVLTNHLLTRPHNLPSSPFFHVSLSLIDLDPSLPPPLSLPR